MHEDSFGLVPAYEIESIQDLNFKLGHSNYCKVARSNTSHFEAHAGFFRLLMKGIFDPYDKTLIS